MCVEQIENIYGKAMTAKELAAFLKVDSRTLVKYAHKWGGVEVAPGTWRFFENRIKEVIDANVHDEERFQKISRQRSGSGNTTAKMVSGRQPEVGKSRNRLGGGNQKSDRRGTRQDPHGLLDDV